MKKIFTKILYLASQLNHRGLAPEHHYYIRDNYLCRIVQIKYLFDDYLIKKKYKEISYHGEFQQELLFVLPFAYWHSLNGTLNSTISCTGTKDLYFFSSNHKEEFFERDWESNYSSFEVPNMTHCVTFDYSKWLPVPLKSYYKNDTFLYDKPPIIIANKYNMEWGGPPVNYFSVPVLERMINLLKTNYTIIYNRPSGKNIVSDNSEIMELNDYDYLRSEHPDVVLLEDMYLKHQGTVNSFNHFQLLLYANCDNFVSVHGGTAALASCFGGKNIIFSKKGIEHPMNEFATIFPKLSGATILHAKSEDDIFSYLHEYY